MERNWRHINNESRSKFGDRKADKKDSKHSEDIKDENDKGL